ncbi:MAG: glycosyltransferase [Phycisphaerae bacterium]|nr:glycosyltransferase [Phycisphaerae bacterium]MDW8261816.1 glycosyltransferase [Phycisphaerales bacterium]
MNYLVVNHIPFALGSARDLVRSSSVALDDFRAQAAALREVAIRMMIAAPVVPAHHPAAARCDSEPFAPDAFGFELLHLPVYQSMRAYLRVKGRLIGALRQCIASAEIVQLGYGGHPMMLGEVGWPIAGELGRRRVWMFDATEPFAVRRFAARRHGSVLRRVLKDRLIAHQIRFCRRAIAEADLVISHHPAVADRFRRVWGGHCHRFDAPLYGQADLPTEAELTAICARRADNSRPLRLAFFPPIRPTDPADHVIRALAHCRRLSVPVELMCIGSREDFQQIQELAGALAMGEFVCRRDTPSDVRLTMKHLDECDALICVSSEGIVETQVFPAMARGLPVVAYENPATDRLIETAGAGNVIPFGNVLLLAQAILDLHRRRALLNRFGERAWRAAATRTREHIHRQRARRVAEMVAMSRTAG